MIKDLNFIEDYAMSKKEIAFEIFKVYALISFIENLGINMIMLNIVGLILNEGNKNISTFIIVMLCLGIFDYISKDWE